MIVTCKSAKGHQYDLNIDNVTFATPSSDDEGGVVVYFVGGGAVTIRAEDWATVKTLVSNRERKKK